MHITRYITPTRSFGSFGLARSPWTGLEREIDRLFETVLTDSSTSSNRFPVDVYEDASNTYVRAELPGIDRKELNVEIVDGVLNLSAERKTKEGEQEATFAFNRTVTLPTDVQADKVSAAYENGVLTVTLPKKEEAKPKKITVAVS